MAVRIGSLLLPPFQPAVGCYRKCIRNGNLLLTSTHFGMDDEGKTVPGRVGVVGLDPKATVSAEDARKLARNAGLRLLSTLHWYLEGDLDRIEQVIRLVGVVNGTESFSGHGKVIDGCCEVLVEALGEERGKGVRTCLGSGSLAAAVTCDLEVRLRD